MMVRTPSSSQGLWVTAAAGPGGLLADEARMRSPHLSGFEQACGARQVRDQRGPHRVSDHGGEVVEGGQVEGGQRAEPARDGRGSPAPARPVRGRRLARCRPCQAPAVPADRWAWTARASGSLTFSRARRVPRSIGCAVLALVLLGDAGAPTPGTSARPPAARECRQAEPQQARRRPGRLPGPGADSAGAFGASTGYGFDDGRGSSGRCRGGARLRVVGEQGAHEEGDGGPHAERDGGEPVRVLPGSGDVRGQGRAQAEQERAPGQARGA